MSDKKQNGRLGQVKSGEVAKSANKAVVRQRLRPAVARVVVSKRGFLQVDGIPVCKVLPNGRLQFQDKDGRRAARRGTRMVSISPDEIAAAVCCDAELNDGD